MINIITLILTMIIIIITTNNDNNDDNKRPWVLRAPRHIRIEHYYQCYCYYQFYYYCSCYYYLYYYFIIISLEQSIIKRPIQIYRYIIYQNRALLYAYIRIEHYIIILYAGILEQSIINRPIYLYIYIYIYRERERYTHIHYIDIHYIHTYIHIHVYIIYIYICIYILYTYIDTWPQNPPAYQNRALVFLVHIIYKHFFVSYVLSLFMFKYYYLFC